MAKFLKKKASCRQLEDVIHNRLSVFTLLFTNNTDKTAYFKNLNTETMKVCLEKRCLGLQVTE